MFKFSKLLFVFGFVLFTGNVMCAESDGKPISSMVECLADDKIKLDYSLCKDSVNTTCVKIPSSTYTGAIAVCTPIGTEYCLTDSDCTVLGKSKCIADLTTLTPFMLDSDNPTDYVGICASGLGTPEDNVLADFLCKLVKTITGKIGRGIVAIIVIVVGMMFFTGKVSWNAMLATGLGVGTVFGVQSLVSLITGGSFICK
jgi:type IV secretory pathway VirB2 component (pilin)